MRLPALLAVVILFPVLTPAVARAGGLAVFNQSSLARAAALPALGGPAVLAAGESETRLQLDWTTEYFERENTREALTIDAETRRYALSYRRGFGGSIVPLQGWEWSAELPLVSSGGGMLDSVIEIWHEIFGLPNGGREQAPRDRYRIRYVRDGETLLDLEQGDTGLGDLRLGLGRALGERWTLRAMLQLPTGDADRLSGGHTGGAVWTDFTLPLGASERAALTLSGGVAAATTNGPLGSRQQPFTGLGGAALALPLFAGVEALVQFQLHSALYTGSSLKPLDGASGQLAMGLRIPVYGRRLTLGFQEDLIVNASPDFSLHLGWDFGRSAGER